jgi:hypothetical protein
MRGRGMKKKGVIFSWIWFSFGFDKGRG